MEDVTLNDLSQLLNTPAVKNVVKPTVLTVGAIWLLKALYYIALAIRMIIKVYIVPNFKPLNLKKKYGDYVVITNLGDEISQEFAKAFARKGHSLIFITANHEKLDTFKSEVEKILEKHGGKLMTIIKDVTRSDIDIYDEVETELENKQIKGQIGILVNNAGIVGKTPGNFLKFTKEFVLGMTHCHVIDFLMITKIVLKIMVENQRGLILNVTSPRNCRPLSQSGFPRSMRQFVDEFTKIIGAEFSVLPNLDIEVLNPGCIVTDGESSESTLYPTSAEFVESAMPKIGRVQQTSGYWLHSLTDTLMAIIPEFINQIAFNVTRKLGTRQTNEYSPIPGSNGV